MLLEAQGRGGYEVQICQCVTSELDGSGWPMPRPGSFTRGKEPRYALYRRLGGPQGQSGWVWRKENLFSTPGFRNLTINPVPTTSDPGVGRFGILRLISRGLRLVLPAQSYFFVEK